MVELKNVSFRYQSGTGEEVLKEGCDSLHAEAGGGGTHCIKARDDHEVEQDIDDDPSGCYEVELFETAIGGKQCSEDVSC